METEDNVHCYNAKSGYFRGNCQVSMEMAFEVNCIWEKIQCIRPYPKLREATKAAGNLTFLVPLSMYDGKVLLFQYYSCVVKF